MAAAAALIPLIIHLFSKRRVKIIEFSSLKHLKSMQRRQVRRLKIRQLLLLILRMLIIFVVVLAFARPTSSGGSIGSHASVSAVILFDNSGSMNRYVKDGLLFDLAKNWTMELLENFGESDDLAILASGAGAGFGKDISYTSPAIASERVNAIMPGHSLANFSTALDKSLELLEQAGNLNRELYIITDRQRNSLPDEVKTIDTSIQVYLVDLPVEEVENLGIVNVDFGGRLLIPGKPFELSATVKNYGNEEQDNIIASLSVNGSRVSQTSLKVPAGKESTVRFSHTLSGGGSHSGYVELSDDKFVTDNRYYFSFQIPGTFNVLIIDGDAASDLIKLALVPTELSGQYWSVKQTSPENLAGVSFREYDVVVLSGAPNLPSTIVDRLNAFVRGGKSMLITYSGETDIANFNANWSELSGVVFDEPLDKNFSGAGFYSLDFVDNKHPVFSVFDFTKNSLPQIRFFTLPKVRATGETSVLMRFSGDRVALAENKLNSGRVLTFCGPISPVYTDLTAHAFFVPFVSRMMEYLASSLSAYDVALYTGSNVVRNVTLRGSLDRAIELVLPDSQVIYVPPIEGTGTVTYNPPSVDIPGIYRAVFEGREIDRFAVNVDPKECDLAGSTPDQTAKAIGAASFHKLETDQPLNAALAELRFGKELWQVFLWIAAVLILLELLLSRSAPEEE